MESFAWTQWAAFLDLLKVGITGLGNIGKEEGQPLLNQLIDDCVMAIPSGGVPRPLPASLKPKSGTWGNLWKLRIEAFKIHVGFSTRQFVERNDTGLSLNESLFLRTINTSPTAYQVSENRACFVYRP